MDDYDRAMEAEALLREIRRDQYTTSVANITAIDAYFAAHDREEETT